jgi:hypothetical protein
MFGRLQLARSELLEYLKKAGKSSDQRLIRQQMDVLRHQDICSDTQSSFFPDLFQYAFGRLLGQVCPQ